MESWMDKIQAMDDLTPQTILNSQSQDPYDEYNNPKSSQFSKRKSSQSCNTDPTQPQKRARKVYVPKYGSCNYAMMVCLYQFYKEEQNEVSKKDLMERAQNSNLSTAGIYNIGQNIAKSGFQRFDAWVEFRKLDRRDPSYVKFFGKPVHCTLTRDGHLVAQQLYQKALDMNRIVDLQTPDKAPSRPNPQNLNNADIQIYKHSTKQKIQGDKEPNKAKHMYSKQVDQDQYNEFQGPKKGEQGLERLPIPNSKFQQGDRIGSYRTVSQDPDLFLARDKNDAAEFQRSNYSLWRFKNTETVQGDLGCGRDIQREASKDFSQDYKVLSESQMYLQNQNRVDFRNQKYNHLGKHKKEDFQPDSKNLQYKQMAQPHRAPQQGKIQNVSQSDTIQKQIEENTSKFVDKSKIGSMPQGNGLEIQTQNEILYIKLRELYSEASGVVQSKKTNDPQVDLGSFGQWFEVKLLMGPYFLSDIGSRNYSQLIQKIERCQIKVENSLDVASRGGQFIVCSKLYARQYSLGILVERRQLLKLYQKPEAFSQGQNLKQYQHLSSDLRRMIFLEGKYEESYDKSKSCLAELQADNGQAIFCESQSEFVFTFSTFCQLLPQEICTIWQKLHQDFQNNFAKNGITGTQTRRTVEQTEVVKKLEGCLLDDAPPQGSVIIRALWSQMLDQILDKPQTQKGPFVQAYETPSKFYKALNTYKAAGNQTTQAEDPISTAHQDNIFTQQNIDETNKGKTDIAPKKLYENLQKMLMELKNGTGVQVFSKKSAALVSKKILGR